MIFMENGVILEKGASQQLFEAPRFARTRQFLGTITRLAGPE
jgi:ABC-type histidine transport system ATPase subunit